MSAHEMANLEAHIRQTLDPATREALDAYVAQRRAEAVEETETLLKSQKDALMAEDNHFDEHK